MSALVEATGFGLNVGVRRCRPDRLTGPLGIQLRRHRGEVLRVARTGGISTHGVFGSVAREQGRPDSEANLLVDLPAGIGLFGLARVQEQLEQIMGVSVELVPVAGLKSGVRPTVLSELVPLRVGTRVAEGAARRA